MTALGAITQSVTDVNVNNLSAEIVDTDREETK